ncbi:MAG: substrate-binding domain-containing protein [Enterobacterales bacterium endosymbiont of Blomia tropicalis]|uniref:substrate-binding domain-containing protein n=1 Tax=Mixta mediterraneensis TaxID=2758443 RepID=UPI0025A83137|nr:substrate-binding domain-containing protein [Mixta mediterraneensis]MDL4914583.1 substrate-binding domain-containing protein [Mixta mediterraneensis]
MMNNTIKEMQLRSAKTHVIGVVCEGLTHPHTSKMLDELTRQLNARGYLTLLLNINSQDHYPMMLRKAGQLPVDGLVFLSNQVDEPSISTAVANYPFPFIHLCPATTAPGLSADDYAAGAALGRLLLSQGYQRFGYMQSQDASSTLQQRMKGYIASLDAADKSLNQRLIADGHSRERAYQSMLAYLKKSRAAERIEALFCENDLLAFGAIQAIRDFGQATHIGVVGFGDVDEARSSTWHLTSWAQRCDLLVSEALNRLLDNRVAEEGAWRQGELQIRHAHRRKETPGEMATCGCTGRH